MQELGLYFFVYKLVGEKILGKPLERLKVYQQEIAWVI